MVGKRPKLHARGPIGSLVVVVVVVVGGVRGMVRGACGALSMADESAGRGEGVEAHVGAVLEIDERRE